VRRLLLVRKLYFPPYSASDPQLFFLPLIRPLPPPPLTLWIASPPWIWNFDACVEIFHGRVLKVPPFFFGKYFLTLSGGGLFSLAFTFPQTFPRLLKSCQGTPPRRRDLTPVFADQPAFSLLHSCEAKRPVFSADFSDPNSSPILLR